MTTAPVSKLRLLPIAALASMMAGCGAIKGIFEAGVWVGVIMVVLVIALIGFVVAKVSRS